MNVRLLSVLSPLFFGILPVSSVQGADLFVDIANPCPGTGSVVDPFCAIQPAIDAANPGDTIHVAPGTYNEAINFNGKGVTLTGTAGPDVTIIDATGLNSSVVTCTSGEGPDTVLDRFTITGGAGTGIVYPSGVILRGGGMYCVDSSPTITNNIFSSMTLSGLGSAGSGIFNERGSPTISNCSFINNVTTGTSVRAAGMTNFSGTPTVVDCLFVGNVSSGIDAQGGAMSSSGAAIVRNCRFENNHAPFGGGMLNSGDNSRPTIEKCMFNNNTASYGGAMHNNSNAAPLLTDCMFSDNVASENGGAIRNNRGNPTAIQCIFTGNQANGNGGAVSCEEGTDATFVSCTFVMNNAAFGGGMSNAISHDLYPIHVQVTNCVFFANSAGGDGGAIFNAVPNTSDVVVTNSTFFGNSAGVGGLFNGGGAIYVGRELTRITNCILWANSDADGIDESAQILKGIFGTVDVNYSCVQGWTGTLPGADNIATDPKFLNAGAGVLHLRPDSPCVDAGDNAAANLPATDLAGNDRVIDGDGNMIGVVDMGAYEYRPVGADFDEDGDVDVFDFLTFSACYNGSSNPPNPHCAAVAADFDGDGDVDGNDFLTFGNCFNAALSPPGLNCP